jgi:hypothetical protein
LLERLNDAMEYVEAHLGERIEVAELARIAMTSEYHFRRMFSALAGLPLSEYIRRRRMTWRCGTATTRGRASPAPSGPCTASAPARPGVVARFCGPSNG